jgi:DNA-binding NarL/FixJ family response regulator
MRPTALVVDDHPSFRKMARRLLAAAGYDVVGEAADAAGAVIATLEWHPAFVLLDVLLPDGSGIDVADLIDGPGAPVVLLVSSRAAADFGTALDGRRFVTKSELTVERLRGLVGGG